ncbi:unnamed protein product, partial [Cylicostephanus goldi]
MFKETFALKEIALPNNFTIKEDASFKDVGSEAGSHWTEKKSDNTESLTFDADALIEHHNAKRDDQTLRVQTSRYVRKDVTKGTFGDCVWEYVSNSDKSDKAPKGSSSASNTDVTSEDESTYTLRIYPSGGKAWGELGSWGGQNEDPTPPWKRLECENHYSNTTKIEIVATGEGSELYEPVRAKTCAGMFSGFSRLKEADLSGLDVASAVSLERMFSGCKQLVSLNLEAWNVSSVTSMASMFQGCETLTTVGNLGKWDTKKVESMQSMFAGCSSLTSLDLSGWDTKLVTAKNAMFAGTSSLWSIRLGPPSTFTLFSDDDAEAAETAGTTGTAGAAEAAGTPTHSTSFGEAGSRIMGGQWMRAEKGDESDPNNPSNWTVVTSDGKEAGSADALMSFHRDSTQAQWYIRQSATEGTSDTCVWEYVPNNADALGGSAAEGAAGTSGDTANVTYTLRIRPLKEGIQGVLADWVGKVDEEALHVPPWKLSQFKEYRLATTKIVVEGSVKPPSDCSNMFSDFPK